MFRDHLGTKPVPESSAVVAPGGEPAAKPASSKDSIIVADFINKTGDAVFDTTLNQALRVQLAQSPVLDMIRRRGAQRRRTHGPALCST
jgi:hypothetical protein